MAIAGQLTAFDSTMQLCMQCCNLQYSRLSTDSLLVCDVGSCCMSLVRDAEDVN